MNEPISLSWIQPKGLLTSDEWKQLKAVQAKLEPMRQRALSLINDLPGQLREHAKKLLSVPEASKELGDLDQFRRDRVGEHNAIRRSIHADMFDAAPLLKKICAEAAKVVAAELREVQARSAAEHDRFNVPFEPMRTPVEQALDASGKILASRADAPAGPPSGVSLTTPHRWLSEVGLGHLLPAEE